VLGITIKMKEEMQMKTKSELENNHSKIFEENSNNDKNEAMNEGNNIDKNEIDI